MFKNLFNRPRIKVQTVKKDDYSGWIKCSGCSEMVHDNELEKNKFCCPKCDYHYRLTGMQRIELLSDTGTFREMFTQFQAMDPLNFVDSEPYKERIQKAKKKTGRDEGAIVGTCKVEGLLIALGVLDFSFMGGSMGSVVGEKLTSIIEYGLEHNLPVVIVSASGGARMQESILSLMQMAKTSAALGKLHEAGLPYISILTNPTTGGVTASFASLGDIIIAEPDALIGFAGSRVVEQTIGQKLPPGAQKSEFLLEKGMIDCIVCRHELKNKLHLFLRFLTGNARDFKDFSEVDEKAFGQMPQKLKELLICAEQELANVK